MSKNSINISKAEFKETLSKGLWNMELEIEDELVKKLWIYLNFLIEENQKYNLTGIEEPEEIISKHFLDSLIIFKKLKIKKNSKIIDVGTGAGFPGLVLKIYRPDLKILLLDSLAKRINFLEILIKKLDLEGIKAVHARAEKLADMEEHREKYHLAVSRAVAPINILSEYTIPFVAPGGEIVFYKGPDYHKELEDGENAITILGARIEKVHQVEIPEMEGERFLINLLKINNTDNKYPRRAGIPKKRPL